MKKRIIVLFGGPSSEREVSRVSARTIVQFLDTNKYDVIPLAIDAEGKFINAEKSAQILSGEVPSKFLEAQSEIITEKLVPIEFEPGRVDVVFPIIHGALGEDGLLQGFLETLNIPYVGPGVAGSAISMDKAIFKSVMRDAGIPVTKDIAIRKFDWEKLKELIVRKACNELTLPLFVKPAHGGSSVGITKVKTMDDFEAAMAIAFKFDNRVLVEEGIDGQEIEVSVLGNEEPRASVPGEIVPGHEFYDYEDKYLDDKSYMIIPAKLPKEVIAEIQELAIKAFITADCEGMARVDFFVEKDTNRVLLNELNTLPGFTSISMYPKMWEASGLPISELLDELIQFAEERHARQQIQRKNQAPPKELK